MKIMTSYFYQIRFMKPNYIPLSTAIWDPKWFHQGKNQSFQWKDKNGVWNGLRAEIFMPGKECEGLCRGPETCNAFSPKTCSFLQVYRQQLDKLDFDEVLKRFENISNQIQQREQFKEEPICVLIVHETYSNPCSERWVIKDWFNAHGYDIKEFNQ